MDKRVTKFEFNIGTTNRSTEDVSKALELVQREHDRDNREKDELRHLNDRFAHILANIEQLKRINEQLQTELKDEFTKWGILPRDENDLKQIINQINTRAIQRATDEVHLRAWEQEAAVSNRVATLYGNVHDLYKRKQENLRHLIDRLQDELNRLLERERSSDEDLKTTRDDLLKELNKFHERLQDWLRLVIDKQTLLDDIQSIRERINLINALNEEEINEWKRLLEQSRDDSISFYREELTNAIRDIKRDYAKQAKKFQDELEYQIEGQLRLVENQLKQMTGLHNSGSTSEDSDKNRAQLEETKLRAIMEEYDKEQVRLNELTKTLSDKRRLLRDEEGKLHEIERKIRDKQCQERSIAERLKNEYDDLRLRFEQMAFELRFSIEDELRIYARLLDELMKKSVDSSFQSNTTATAIESQSISSVTSSGLFDLASTHSGWPPTTNFSRISTETLPNTRENEIHETFDGDSIIRSTSFNQ